FFDPSQPKNLFWQSEEDHIEAWCVCREINAFPIPKTMQNGLYDCSYFIRDQMPPRDYIFDSQYMWWAMFMELPKRLDFIASVLIDSYQYWKDDIKGSEQASVSQNMESYWRYGALDGCYTLFSTLYLLQLLSLD